MDIRAKAEALQPFVCECRRTLHSWPELAMEEFKTTDFICEKLDEMQIEYRRTNPTGCIAEIHGGKPGRTIALRADIDALNIQEKNDLPFRSQRDGFMHACAHDTHAAMLLGAAKILQEMKDELCGTVRLIFQPAEEDGTGALAMVAQGAMEGVDACFGQHIFGGTPVGSMGTKAGPMTPFVDIFRIKIHGVSSHGAMPHTGVDATVCAAALVMNLQTIVSREVNPQTPLVVTVGSLHSGTRYNVTNGEAYMEGTVRVFDPEVHDRVEGIVRRISDYTAAAYRCTAEVEYEYGSKALVNDAEMTELVRKAAAKIQVEGEHTEEHPGTMGGEDFSVYSQMVPSSFFTLGCGGTVSNHNEYLIVDEAAFPAGVAMHVQVALDFLNGQ